MGSHLYHRGKMVKLRNNDMVKWGYGRMIGMYKYGFRSKWCNYLFCFHNGLQSTRSKISFMRLLLV